MSPSPTMNLEDVARDMRSRGMKIRKSTISDCIASGVFPFGKVLSTGATGRRHILIFRSDYEAWASEKLGATIA